MFVVATTIFGFMVLAVDLGIQDLALQRFSGRETEDDLDIPYATLRTVCAFGVATGAAFLLIGALTLRARYAPVPAVLVALFPYIILGNVATRYRIRNRMPAAALVSAIGVMSFGAIGPIVGVLIRPSATSAAIGSTAALAICAVGWTLIFRSIDFSLPSRAETRSILRSSRPFLLTGLSVAMYSRGDRLVVAWLSGPAQAGLYGAAYSLIYGASLLSASVHIVVLPRMILSWNSARTWKGDCRRLISVMWMIGVPGVLVMYFFSDSAVHVLYGHEFQEAAELVRLLSPLVLLYFLNVAVGVCLIASERQRAVAGVASINLIVGGVLYFSMTPLFGAKGAAGASVLVEVCGHLLLLRALRSSWARAPVE